MNTITDDSNSTEPGSNAETSPVKNLDLADSPHDAERMKEEIFTIDLPDVSDIPGQEHVHVPLIREMYDVTVSSDDEEGVGLFNDDDETGADLRMGNEGDVISAERTALRAASEDMPTEDNALLREAALDNRDDEGDPLNEGSSASKISGDDLDVAGAEEDDTDEIIGEEDEENNSYSLGADDKDEIPADNF